MTPFHTRRVTERSLTLHQTPISVRYTQRAKPMDKIY